MRVAIAAGIPVVPCLYAVANAAEAEAFVEEKEMLEAIQALRAAVTVLSKHHGEFLQQHKSFENPLARSRRERILRRLNSERCDVRARA